MSQTTGTCVPVEDIQECHQPSITLITGSRATGKTTLAKNIISLVKPDSVLISSEDPWEEFNDGYTKYPSIGDACKSVIKLKDSKLNLLIWIRDVDIFESNLFKNPDFMRLIQYNRCYNLSFIIEQQFLNLPPTIRCNINNVYLTLKNNKLRGQFDIKRYFEYFGSNVSYTEFRERIYNSPPDMRTFCINRLIPVSYSLSPVLPALKVLDTPSNESQSDSESQVKQIKNEIISVRKTLTGLLDKLDKLDRLEGLETDS